MRIGIAGVGKMGAAIGHRLIDVGHEVVVWNRTPGKTDSLAASGARVATSPNALARDVEVILTILTHAEAQDTVYLGADGLLADGACGGKLVIDMSTVRPAEASRLADRVRAAGAAFVECPVGGTTGPARQGKLLGLAGGEAADFARAKPLLDQMCRRVEHVGPVGAGASLKLAINLPLMVYYQALGESLLICRHLGLDPKWTMELFADTSGAPSVLKVRGAAIAQAIAGDLALPPAFDVDSVCKDLRQMIAEGASRGGNLPVTSAALAVFEEAQQSGWGARDGATLPAFWSLRNSP